MHQLALLGLSAGQIAARTKTRKADVADALTASASTVATKASERYAFLTLDQAAALAEFDQPDRCDPEAVTVLVAAAQDGPVQFARALAAARDKAADRAARAAAAAELTNAGVRVLEEPDWRSPMRRLDALTGPDGQPLSAAAHAECPGHAAWIDHDWIRDPNAPEPDDNDVRDRVDDAGDDGDDDGDDEANWQLVYTPVYVCTDPAGYGHGSRGRRTFDGDTVGYRAADGPTGAQVDDAAARAEAARQASPSGR